jgi:hypothetical protein
MVNEGSIRIHVREDDARGRRGPIGEKKRMDKKKKKLRLDREREEEVKGEEALGKFAASAGGDGRAAGRLSEDGIRRMAEQVRRDPALMGFVPESERERVRSFLYDAPYAAVSGTDGVSPGIRSVSLPTVTEPKPDTYHEVRRRLAAQAASVSEWSAGVSRRGREGQGASAPEPVAEPVGAVGAAASEASGAGPDAGSGRLHSETESLLPRKEESRSVSIEFPPKESEEGRILSLRDAEDEASADSPEAKEKEKEKRSSDAGLRAGARRIPVVGDGSVSADAAYAGKAESSEVSAIGAALAEKPVPGPEKRAGSMDRLEDMRRKEAEIFESLQKTRETLKEKEGSAAGMGRFFRKKLGLGFLGELGQEIQFLRDREEKLSASHEAAKAEREAFERKLEADERGLRASREELVVEPPSVPTDSEKAAGEASEAQTETPEAERTPIQALAEARMAYAEADCRYRKDSEESVSALSSAKQAYLRALSAYKEAAVRELTGRGLQGEDFRKGLADIYRDVLDQQDRLYDDRIRARVSTQEFRSSWMSELQEKALGAIDRYRKLPTGAKIGISLTLAGVGMAAGATGGAGAALGWLALRRGISGAVAGRGVFDLAEAWARRGRTKEIEAAAKEMQGEMENFDSDPETMVRMFYENIERRSGDTDARLAEMLKGRRRRAAIGLVSGVSLAVFGLSHDALSKFGWPFGEEHPETPDTKAPDASGPGPGPGPVPKEVASGAEHAGVGPAPEPREAVVRMAEDGTSRSVWKALAGMAEQAGSERPETAAANALERFMREHPEKGYTLEKLGRITEARLSVVADASGNLEIRSLEIEPMRNVAAAAREIHVGRALLPEDVANASSVGPGRIVGEAPGAGIERPGLRTEDVVRTAAGQPEWMSPQERAEHAASLLDFFAGRNDAPGMLRFSKLFRESVSFPSIAAGESGLSPDETDRAMRFREAAARVLPKGPIESLFSDTDASFFKTVGRVAVLARREGKAGELMEGLREAA